LPKDGVVARDGLDEAEARDLLEVLELLATPAVAQGDAAGDLDVELDDLTAQLALLRVVGGRSDTGEQLGGPGGALVLGQPLCAGSDIERVNIGRHRATPVL
jgi:hypothetical protein